MSAETLNGSRPDSHNPNLGVWQSFAKAIHRGQLNCVNLILASFEVDCGKLAYIFIYDIVADRLIEDGIAALGKLFFAVAPAD